MLLPHGTHAKLMRDTRGGAPYHAAMMTMDSRPTRTLTLVIHESDWHALRAAEPDAIGWLHSCIRERLASTAGVEAASRYSAPSPVTADSWWGNDDEY